LLQSCSRHTQTIFPKGDVSFLHPSEVRIYLCNLRIALGGRKGAILGGTVDLILPVFKKSLYVGGVFHGRKPSCIVFCLARLGPRLIENNLAWGFGHRVDQSSPTCRNRTSA